MTSSPLALTALFTIVTLGAPLPAQGPVAAGPPQAAAPQQHAAQPPVAPVLRRTEGTLFENVVGILQERYFDERVRAGDIPALASQYADRARVAVTLRQQREVVHAMLSNLRSSHLGLLSTETHQALFADLQGRAYPAFGFQLVNIGGQYYASTLLEGGPALRAGLLGWDRVVSIDGVATADSARLDWRSDDAYLTDERDPAMHQLLAAKGDRIRLEIERRPGAFVTLTVPAEEYSAFDAAKASARIHEIDGRTVGYLHFWYLHLTGVPELLRESLDGPFRDCHAIVVDLRGRGGNFMAIAQIVAVIRADRAARNRPIVALVDRHARSGKDILAYEFKQAGIARLVGEPSAGAVIPATFADVGHGSILMFPSVTLPRYTELIEFKPVEPDVFVERAGPLSAGHDPILNAGLVEAARLAKEERAK